MTPLQYVRALAGWWWLVLGGALLGLVVGLVASQAPPAQVVATANVLLRPSVASSYSAADVASAQGIALQRAATYTALGSSADVEDELARSLGLPVTQVARDLTVSTPSNTAIISIRFTARSSDAAVTGAATAADIVVERITRAEERGEGAPPILTAAVPNDAATAPEVSEVAPWRNPALTLVGGLLLGAVAAVAAARGDRRLRNAETVSAVLDSPVIARVERGRRFGVLPPRRTSRDPIGVLRAVVLEQGRKQKDGLRLLLVSPDHRTSHLDVAVRLTESLTRARVPALVVDADLRRTGLADLVAPDEANAGTGLAEAVAGRGGDPRRHRVAQGFDVVLAGQLGSDSAADLLSSPDFVKVLDRLSTDYGVVVLAAGGLADDGGAIAVAGAADHVLVVVEQGRTRRADLRRAAEQLDRIGRQADGAVVIA